MRAVVVGLLCGAWLVSAVEGLAQECKPNIVVLLADDLGWGDLSLHGNTNLCTPHLDRLGRAGVRLRHFYVCPVCAPTRAEFLTGRYHPRSGALGVTEGRERMNLDELTLAQVLQQHGYATGAFGKWHNGTQFPYHPNARGFEEFFGFCSGHWGNYFDPLLEHNNRLVRTQGYIADIITDRAIEFIRRNRHRPFFCYVAYNTPHSPFQVPERFYKQFVQHPISLRHYRPEREDVRQTRAVLAMCANLDWNVGRIMEALERWGLKERTLVVFFSDNGPATWRYNGRMRGRKGSTDEGGVRSPCFFVWPGHLPQDVELSGVAAAVDLMPTLLDLAGIHIHPPKPWDGISLKPYLIRGRPLPGRVLFSHFRGRVSVRTARFRLDHRGRLYDLEQDPSQTQEVSDRWPHVARLLRRAAQRWRQEVLPPPASKDHRPFPVGGAQITWLPARDGKPHGNIRRSAPAPNCSYFTHWTSTEDFISWDVEVLHSGRYEVWVYYTCRPEDVGVRLQVKFASQQVSGTLHQAHDSPLLGTQGEHFPRRAESYVKHFRPWKLGTINLPQARGTLTIRALHIPGNQAIELRWLKLVRVDPTPQQKSP